MRGDQLARQWRVLKKIEANPQGLTVAEIAKLAGSPLRTVYRDLEALEAAGFPLYGDKEGEGGQRWKFVDSFHFKTPVPISFTELIGLHLSRDLFKIFAGTLFYESLDSLFAKIRNILPPNALAFLDRMQSAFSTSIRPYREYEKYREIIGQVSQAVTDRRSIEMAYHSLGRETETLRKVDPYRVWFFDGTLYLIGFCHLRQEVRTFVVDRIRMLTVTEEVFSIPAGFDLAVHMQHSFKVMQDRLVAVTVRISPAWSRYVGEKIWHESQQTVKNEDGSLELSFKVAGLNEIKQWVLSLGPEACVVAPEELKALVKRDLVKALGQYEDVPLPDEAPEALRRTDHGR